MKYKFDDIAYNITLKRSPKKEDSLKYIGLEHLDSGSLTVRRYGLDVDLKGDKLIMKKGDVLLGKRNAYLRRAAIAPHDGLFSAHGMVLRPKEDVVDKDYFPFFVSSDRFFDEVIRISVGGLSPTVNWRDLKELEFDLPTLDQQKVLAEKLWAAYEVKQSYLKMIKATQEMVQSQFIEMFGDKKNGSVLTVGEISSMLFAGGDKPKDISLCKTEDYKYPVWANGIGDNGLMGFSRTYQVDKKSLTISARGTIGYCSIREPYYTPVVRLIVIIPNEKIELTYLKYFFENTGFEKTGAVQGQLTIPILKEKKVYVPSVVLQKKFVSIVQQADKSEFELRKSIDAIDAVIKSLINS